MSVSSYESSPIQNSSTYRINRSLSEDFDLLSMPDSTTSMSSQPMVGSSTSPPTLKDDPRDLTVATCSTITSATLVSSPSYDSEIDDSTITNTISQTQQLQPLQPRRQREVLSDAVHPQKYAMKTSRRQKTAVGVVSGAFVGTCVFPVVGTVVGGYIGGYATNKIHKTTERRAQRKWEQTSFQSFARQSPVVNAEYV